MKIYEIEYKKSENYSREKYIIAAESKKELEKYATEHLDINVGTFYTLWNIKELPNSGVIYQDIH